ncbi:MAG: hypothetical protein ACODAJ_14665 [Planctomycetota bacterium]
MKFCVCGKGGSGKSTVVALLAVEFRRRGNAVLVVDSDESNAGLYWMLGLEAPPTPLMELAGGKRSIQRTLRAALSDSDDDQEMPVLAREALRVDELPSEYVGEAEGMRLVCIGKIHQALEGCACPMGVLSREFLKKLQTAPDEVVIVDMEAGVEHFGRGVETSVDAVLAVVEPSLESVSLAARIKVLTEGAGADFRGAVLNKVASQATRSRLEETLGQRRIPILAALPVRHEFVQAALDGSPVETGPVQAQVRDLADALGSGAVAAPSE